MDAGLWLGIARIGVDLGRQRDARSRYRFGFRSGTWKAARPLLACGSEEHFCSLALDSVPLVSLSDLEILMGHAREWVDCGIRVLRCGYSHADDSHQLPFLLSPPQQIPRG